MVPREGSRCSQKTLARLPPWVSDVCNFMAIPYALLAFHWAFYFPRFRSKPLSPHCGGVYFSLSFFPPISKVRGQTRTPCHSRPWNSRRWFFKWLVARSSDLRASGIFCLKPDVELIWIVCDPSTLAYGWICELMPDEESLKNSHFQVENTLYKVIALEHLKAMGRICCQISETNVFLFVFSFSWLLPHLVKPRLSFWRFCNFFFSGVRKGGLAGWS